MRFADWLAHIPPKRIRLTGEERLALLNALQDLIEVEGGNPVLERIIRKVER